MSAQAAVAVVTGGASGIGLGVVERLAADGKTVAMIDLNEETLEETSSRLRSAGRSVHAYLLDVRDVEATLEVADRIERDLGPVESLVTSAGTSRAASAAEMSLADWQVVLDVNLTGTFVSCQAFGRGMRQRQRGSIVTVSSIGGLGGQANRAAYSASKWGVIGLTKTIGLEWGPQNVRANCVTPGTVDTPLFAKARANIDADWFEDLMTKRTPLQRMAAPSEIAAAVAFLLSEDASYITCAVIPVDAGQSGGYMMGLPLPRP